MNITADAVKQLRERTGAGMMECKKALVEAKGDADVAAENMRKSGLAKADKKASRVAAEGVVIIEKSADGKTGVLVEVNSETDFVARGDDFRGFATEVAKAALASGVGSVEAVNLLKLGSGETVDERRRALIAKIGENVTVRRVALVSAPTVVGSYVHTDNKKAALVAVEGGDADLARDLAMQVVAASPRYLTPGDAPAEHVAKEREIETAKALAEGKPPEIVAKMIEGRMRKSLNEFALTGQVFVKDSELTIEKLLKNAKASVKSFERFEVGAGIEKRQDDFVGEVMAQVKAQAQAKIDDKKSDGNDPPATKH
ncbi:MAG TPA: translation elongation factor Ts [Steroidobacteraceae bacterium]|nr:translation elongation factor Ts [Steroidobacteraceae bacterium]